ncbi:FixH family protein [Daejeonella lutea]|uniref:FixH protein n=1 Tax=Daejeonella lutea TaxID=572036 RepID=A0A1T5A4F1_9SPHI|nr:FixH family protein [Daejeonella lutea]SKB29785.1 FixH protein [Daejeonella lutea]
MNWGTKLTIGMVLFMTFIVTLVVMMLGPHKADSLIENDYYEKGQTFDADYNAKHLAITDKMQPTVSTDAAGVTANFPVPVTYKVSVRRLSDAGMDKEFESDLAVLKLVIPQNQLKSGSWLLRIQYQANGKNYLFQEKIVLP